MNSSIKAWDSRSFRRSSAWEHATRPSPSLRSSSERERGDEADLSMTFGLPSESTTRHLYSWLIGRRASARSRRTVVSPFATIAKPASVRKRDPCSRKWRHRIVMRRAVRDETLRLFVETEELPDGDPPAESPRACGAADRGRYFVQSEVVRREESRIRRDPAF